MSRVRSRHPHPLFRRASLHLPAALRSAGPRRWAALAAAAAAVLAGTGGGVAAASAPAQPAPPVSVALAGSFVFHACPTGTPAADNCLTDDVTGVLPGIGAVSGRFEVHIAYSQAAADDCEPIDKHGVLTAASGGSVELSAAGVFCSDSATAAYNYRVVHGSGALAHASGHGQWLVTAPTTYANGAGTGAEQLFGTLRG